MSGPKSRNMLLSWPTRTESPWQIWAGETLKSSSETAADPLLYWSSRNCQNDPLSANHTHRKSCTKWCRRKRGTLRLIMLTKSNLQTISTSWKSLLLMKFQLWSTTRPICSLPNSIKTKRTQLNKLWSQWMKNSVSLANSRLTEKCFSKATDCGNLAGRAPYRSRDLDRTLSQLLPISNSWKKIMTCVYHIENLTKQFNLS